MDLSIQVSCWESCRLTVVRTPAFPGRHRSSHKNRKGDPKHGIESLTIEMQTFLVGKREQFRDSTSLLHCTGHRGVRRWGDFSFIFISAQFSSASLLPPPLAPTPLQWARSLLKLGLSLRSSGPRPGPRSAPISRGAPILLFKCGVWEWGKEKRDTQRNTHFSLGSAQ